MFTKVDNADILFENHTVILQKNNDIVDNTVLTKNHKNTKNIIYFTSLVITVLLRNTLYTCECK